MAEFGDLDGVRVERDAALLRVTLTNPTARNAQTPATWRRLASIPDLLDESIRAVVIAAEGPSFSAGLDLRMMTPEGVPGEESILSLAGYSADRVDDFIRQAQAAFTWWRTIPQVTVALVQGHAIGAGFQLALACDVMIVADDAQLAMRETSLGLVPDLGGTQPLADRVGYSRAFEICARGRFVGAQEAVRLGIAIDQVPSAQWEAYLADFLAPIVAAPPGAVSGLKALLSGAAADPDQAGRERRAQATRLTELRSLMGG